MSEDTTRELIEAVKEKATDERITCPVLRKLADDLGVSYQAAGEAANWAGVKVKGCELGCF